MKLLWTKLKALSLFALIAVNGFGAERCGSPSSVTPVILSIEINGAQAPQSGPGGSLLLDREGDLMVSKQDLTAWRLNFQEPDVCDHDGVSYVDLLKIAGLSFSLNGATQVLSLRVLPSGFTGHTLDGDEDEEAPLLSQETGAFFNYDVGVETSLQQARTTGLFEAGAFTRWGLFTSTFASRDMQKGHVIRIETSFQRDLPSRRESIRIGDSVANPGTWGRAVYFGGVQWGTDFGTQPDFVTFPLPTMRGEASAPSVADLYVNNALRFSQNVQPGNFDIRNAPVISGSGQMTLVVRDMLGRETITNASYFASSKLLRQGIADYSVAVGKARVDLGVENSRYGRLFVSGSYRRGLTNRITGEVRSEVAGNLKAAGFSSTAHIFGPVLSTVGWVGSQSKDGKQGQMASGSLDLQTRRFSAGLQGQRATAGFRQLGLERLDDNDGRRGPRYQFGAYMGLTTFGRDHLTLSTFRQNTNFDVRYTTATYSVSLRRNFFWSLTATSSSGRERQTTVSTALTIQLGETTSLMPSVTREGREYREQITIQKNRPLGPGLGYRVSAENGPVQQIQGELLAGTNKADYSAAVSKTRAGTALRFGVRGAFGFIRKKLFRSRRIDDSFAVVKVGNIKDVQVLADNQPIAKTGSDGTAIVPRLLSYQRNRLSIDVNPLPLDVSVSRTEMQVTPRRRSGVQVEFEVHSDGGVLLQFADEFNRYIPAGAAVSVDGRKTQNFVGLEGMVYLEELSKGEHRIKLTWAGGSCSVPVEVQQRGKDQRRGGVETCPLD